ncbi:MAG TPA: hypothetical protein VK988_11360, partial [Acidimicrobiales bacterium]|nr:hypothetical protein [Acidimicrobiales bacterium]
MILGTATVRPRASGLRHRRLSPAALAWAAVAGAAAMALAVPVLILAHGATTTLVPTGVVIGFAYPAVGALIARRHPRNAVGWLFIVIGFTQALVAFAFEYATYALDVRPGSLPFGVAMAWLSDWMWFPGYALILTFLLLLFPNGRLPSRRWRPVAGLAALSFALMALTALATVPAQVGR